MIAEFGPFRYDSEQRLLFRGGDVVPLEPKVLETLHVLLESRGGIVSKADLMRRIWPDTTVEDVGLARNISLLRKVLGDESESYIETIPRRGYRFTVAPAAVRPPTKRTVRHWWIAAAVALVALAAVVYYQFYVPSRYLPRGDSIASLAVVPFECKCPGIDAAAFSSGLNEVLVAELSKVDRAQVVSPSTVQRYQQAGMSMAIMGRMLGLDVLVEGVVQRLDERFRVTVRLVDVHTGRVIWAETYDRTGDQGAIQGSLAKDVGVEIGKRLSSAANR